MILRAKYLMVNPETLIENGAVKIVGSRISQSGKFSAMSRHRVSAEKRVLDLGESMIMPGLVNSHSHLEGPELYGGNPPPGEKRFIPPQSFTNWAEQVVNIRLRMTLEDLKKTVSHGYEILLINGITLVGDHTHLERTWSIHRRAKIRRVLFEEIIDLNPLTASQTLVELTRKLHTIPPQADNEYLKAGIAPHAPYSVSAELYKLLFNLARKQNIPLSTHLSELKEENELLAKGTGKIRAFLRKTGRDNHYWRPPGTTSIQYLTRLGILRPPAFFVHCNYLSNRDVNILANSGASVVFCPNSHHYFGHRNHPFRKLLRKKVNIALGTDSLGSNEDLSILKEMKYIQNNYTGVSATQLFRMGTINGLKTLRFTSFTTSRVKEKLGELRTGFIADLSVFPLKRTITPAERVKQDLIDTAPKSILTMVAGKIIYKCI